MTVKSELWGQLANAVKIIDELWKFGAVNSPNLVTLIDTLSQSYLGNHVGSTTAAVKTLRTAISTQSVNTAVLQPIILELAKRGYNSRATAVSDALDDIARGMDALTETVAERNITYGSVTAGGSNVGDGTVLRLTTDEYGNKIEDGAWDGGITKVEITQDKNTGVSGGSEKGLIYGSGVTPYDNLEMGDAPNGSLVVTAMNAANSILTNSDFETSSGTGATLAFTGWTLSDPEDFSEETTVTYNDSDQAIEFEDNANILQYIPDASGSLDSSKPAFLIVPFYRVSSCDGTLTIRLGSQTESVALSAQSGWNLLVLGVADEKGWYNNFKEDSSDLGVRVQISLASRTTGSLVIDNVILAQPSAFNSKYYMLIAGDSDFINGDYFTFTDSVNGTSGGDGRIQFTLSRLFGKYLPHTSGSETYADA